MFFISFAELYPLISKVRLFSINLGIITLLYFWRDYEKFLKYSSASVFVLLIAYPVFHELGHILGVFFTGGKVMFASYMPVPSIVAQFSFCSDADIIISGGLGILFPVIVFLILPIGKNTKTLSKFSSLLFEVVVMMSLAISFIYSLLCICGNGISGDDVIIMDLTNNSILIPVLHIMLMSLILLAGIKKKTHYALKEIMTIEQ